MRFIETQIKGAFLIELEPNEDERGFFARTFCIEEFKAHGLDFKVVQCSISFNKKKGTLRGMHYQAKPYEEAKIVRCYKGAIYDIILDLRPESESFKKWISAELNENNRRALYIPKGVAHGFQTLADDTEVFYMMDEFYHPEYARGIRWDDPEFKIEWPLPVMCVSERDKNYPNFVG